MGRQRRRCGTREVRGKGKGAGGVGLRHREALASATSWTHAASLFPDVLQCHDKKVLSGNGGRIGCVLYARDDSLVREEGVALKRQSDSGGGPKCSTGDMQSARPWARC